MLEKGVAANAYVSWKRVAGSGAALDDVRRKALADIIDATKAAEGGVEIAIGATLASLRAVAAVNPDLPGLPTEEQLQGLLAQDGQAALPQMKGVLVANYASIYASFSTEELLQYVDYLHSPAGAKLHDTALSAIRAVVKDSMDEFGRKLRDARSPSGSG